MGAPIGNAMITNHPIANDKFKQQLAQQTAGGYTPVFMKDGELYERTGFEEKTEKVGHKGLPVKTMVPQYSPYKGKQAEKNSPYPGAWNQNMTSGYPMGMMPSMYGQQQYGNVRHPSPQFGGPSTSTVTPRPMGGQAQSEGQKGGRIRGGIQEQANIGEDFAQPMPVKTRDQATYGLLDVMPKDYNGGVRSQNTRFSNLAGYGGHIISNRQRRPGGTASPKNSYGAFRNGFGGGFGSLGGASLY